MQNPLILALDLPDPARAVRLVEELIGHVGLFKVGSELFTRCGPEIIHRIRQLGGKVFLDLKFHDIPNTVAQATAAAVSLDVSMLTVHCSGGPAMLRAAQQAAESGAAQLSLQPPLVLGVTVLTSLDEAELRAAGVPATPGEQVLRLAQMAYAAGLRGFVCSPQELPELRASLPAETQLITPGIRSLQDSAGDQKRSLSPAEAIRLGASWLVVGRPIYQATDPKAAAQRILAAAQVGGA